MKPMMLVYLFCVCYLLKKLDLKIIIIIIINIFYIRKKIKRKQKLKLKLKFRSYSISCCVVVVVSALAFDSSLLSGDVVAACSVLFARVLPCVSAVCGGPMGLLAVLAASAAEQEQW